MKRRDIGILGSIAILFAACSGSVGDGGSRATETGGIGFRLQLPNGVNVDSVDYTISGPASYEKNGSLTIGTDMTFAGKIDGIPVGDGYIITLSTHGPFPDAECQGSANFGVHANLVTAVGIRLQCPGQKSDAGVAGSASTLVAAGSGSSSAAPMHSAMAKAMGGSPAVAMQTNATAIAGTSGHAAGMSGAAAGVSGAAGTATGGSPAPSSSTNSMPIVGNTGSVKQSVMPSNCPHIDCVSAVPSADGMSVSLHGVAVGTTEGDQHAFAWTASAGTLSNPASSDPVLQCPATAGDVDVSFRVFAGACSDELQMRVSCSGTPTR